MNFYTESIDPSWKRIVHLKLLCNQDNIAGLDDNNLCKIVYIKSGTAAIKYNQTKYKLAEPTLVFIGFMDVVLFDGKFNADVVYFLPNIINDRFTNQLISSADIREKLSLTDFQDALLLKCFYSIDSPKIETARLSAEDSIIISALFKNINKELTEQSNGYWPCRSRSYFIQLLFVINNMCSYISTPYGLLQNNMSSQDKLVSEIISYMSRHIEEKISIKSLTHQFSLNRNKISQAFVLKTGKSPIQYLILLRLQLSLSMLRETELPIREIAERVGFHELTNFSRSFKDAYKMTPSQYRDLNSK